MYRTFTDRRGKERRSRRKQEKSSCNQVILNPTKSSRHRIVVHFQQLLENRPDYWVALARLVEVMRRTDNLEKIPEYLTKSEEFVGTRASLEPGLNFCKGAI